MGSEANCAIGGRQEDGCCFSWGGVGRVQVAVSGFYFPPKGTSHRSVPLCPEKRYPTEVSLLPVLHVMRHLAVFLFYQPELGWGPGQVLVHFARATNLEEVHLMVQGAHA